MDASQRSEPGLGRFQHRPRGDEGRYIVVPEQGRTYLPGTTIAAIGATRYVQRPDGLLVPAAAARGPQALDLIQTYVTYSQLFGYPPYPDYVLEALRGVPRLEFVRSLATLLGMYEKLGVSRSDVDARLAALWFKGPATGIIRGLLQERSTLVAPQTLLLLTQLALLISPDQPDPDTRAQPLPAVILAVQELLGTEPDEDESHVFTGDPKSALFRQVVASHHFGSSADEATTIAHHQERWARLSRAHASEHRSVDLYDAFQEATGLAKDDFTALGLAIWAHCETRDTYPIPASAFASFAMPHDVISASLALVSRTADEFRDLIRQTPAELQTEWSFNLLRRYPLLRLDDGSVLVMSKGLLLDRIYGWLPIFDVVEGLRAGGRADDAARAEGWLRHLCELDALESIRSLAADRLYEDGAIQRAFGTRHKNADAAIEYPDAWIVIEVGTRQLSQATVVATTPDGLERDLKFGIDEKVAQLDATITDLIAGESSLTGQPARTRRRYLAVLVLTEGFPVNPMTTEAIRSRLKTLGYLADARIGPLHILDQEELDMAEAIAEEGGASLLDLLEEHEQSNLARSAFKDWLIVERGRGQGPRRPNRLERARQEGWQPAIDRLRAARAGA